MPSMKADNILVREILSPAEGLTDTELLNFIRYLERYNRRLIRNQSKVKDVNGLIEEMYPFYWIATLMLRERSRAQRNGSRKDPHMAITRNTRVHLDGTEDAVAYIAATVSEVIARAGHEGHDLQTVMSRMTSGPVLNTIRAAYAHWAEQGRDLPTGIREIGVRLIQEYRKRYGI